MAEGEKVGGGYVELGLDKNPFVDSMRSAATTFQSGLQTMGKQAAGFASSIGKALGIAFPTSLGGLISAGLGKWLEDQPKIIQGIMQAATVGVTPEQLSATVESVLPHMRKLGAISKAELTGVVGQFALIGKVTREQLIPVLEETYGLARIGGTTFEQAAKDYIAALRYAKPLPEQYGFVSIPGEHPRVTQERVMAHAAMARPMAREIGKLPEEQLRSYKQSLKDTFSVMFGELIAEPFADPQKWWAELQRDFEGRGFGDILKLIGEAVLEPRTADEARRDMQRASQIREDALKGVGEASQLFHEQASGMTGEQRRSRGGVLTPENILLSDEERGMFNPLQPMGNVEQLDGTQRELRDSMHNLQGSIDALREEVAAERIIDLAPLRPGETQR